MGHKVWVDEEPGPGLMQRRYRELMAKGGLPLPWQVSEEDECVVLAANGACVATADVNRDLPDRVAALVAAGIVASVNSDAGFWLSDCDCAEEKE